MKERVFQYRMKVRDYECDSQGVVNNAIYLHYFEATRHEFMESCGLRLRDLNDEKITPVVRSANLKYNHSLRGSDEFICTVSLEKKGIRYIFHQQAIRIPENIVCTEAVIEVVCLINGKVVKPDLFDGVFAGYL